jgi:hypothetical protein
MVQIPINILLGVLWSGDHLFDGIVETLEMLRSKGRASNPTFKQLLTYS